MVNGINKFAIQLVKGTANKIKNHNADKHLNNSMKHGNRGLKADTVSLNNKATETKEYAKTAGIEVPVDYQVLRSLVGQFLQQQGITGDIDIGETTTSLDDLTPEMAQDLISEDGYWGVEQTSDRIVDFAISAAKNDPKNLDIIKDSITNGLEMAKEAFGGTLPEISQQTYSAAMDKLDAWASNSREHPQNPADHRDTTAPDPASP